METYSQGDELYGTSRGGWKSVVLVDSLQRDVCYRVLRDRRHQLAHSLIEGVC